jgi:serine/tyrosine/threonine adenylyltransferase
MENEKNMQTEIGWNFDNSYLNLPELLYKKVLPTPVSKPRPILINYPLAKDLGLNITQGNISQITKILGGNELPPGAAPLAQAYMGHQFGYPNMLGDGRAILLGEHLLTTGKRFDIQLKGSGPTQYSRRGDGRATLSAMLREYLISEAIHNLGIPSTRSLAVIATGDPVYREQINEGAVLTRVASSHIRVGTFEFATRHLTKDEFQHFLDYVIDRHYPELKEAEDKPIALLRSIMDRQAYLITEWMRVGFIHGVMNTDNMSISGETIDFGPCAFMNHYDPETVFSSIDTEGRYAFANQPSIAQWNLAVFASSLLPLIDDDTEKAIEKAKATINQFPGMYAKHWMKMMRNKLGFITELEGDKKIAEDLLLWMQTQQADYTNTFFHLSQKELPDNALYQEEEFKQWYERWKNRLLSNEEPENVAQNLMQKTNPAFIPRNHKMEEALQAATIGNEISLVHELLEVLGKPYEYREDFSEYQQPPVNGDGSYKTFCGT